MNFARTRSEVAQSKQSKVTSNEPHHGRWFKKDSEFSDPENNRITEIFAKFT